MVRAEHSERHESLDSAMLLVFLFMVIRAVGREKWGVSGDFFFGFVLFSGAGGRVNDLKQATLMLFL